MGELSQIEVEFYKGIGREFISLLENTNMSKVYKMPVLMAFYNNSDVLMEVSEKQLLSSWKEFFSTGTNWKDLDKNMTLQKYKDISDKDHLKKILAMPVHFLLESGKGFFVKNDDVALGLREELRPLIDNPVMIRQMKDVIDYRTMDYYQRRYREKQELIVKINTQEYYIMNRVVKFLKEAETYYLATVEGNQPRVRPFGTAHIFEGKLYIQTGKVKDVSKQIHANPKGGNLCI